MPSQWAILQGGELPLRPCGLVSRFCEHRCTAILLWPQGERPSSRNSVLADPCFTPRGFKLAAKVLEDLRFSLNDASWVFVTHRHRDHMPLWPQAPPELRLRLFEPGRAPAGLRAAPCPGHEADLHALVFRADANEEVWIVGDAILDEEWLLAWQCYWPNGYDAREVQQTWRSVAEIVSRADLIVPGHGAPFRVTPALVRQLIERFPKAPHASECPEVVPLLEGRLAAADATSRPPA